MSNYKILPRKTALPLFHFHIAAPFQWTCSTRACYSATAWVVPSERRASAASVRRLTSFPLIGRLGAGRRDEQLPRTPGVNDIENAWSDLGSLGLGEIETHFVYRFDTPRKCPAKTFLGRKIFGWKLSDTCCYFWKLYGWKRFDRKLVFPINTR